MESTVYDELKRKEKGEIITIRRPKTNKNRDLNTIQ